jgi:hypothetical protein
MGMVCVCSEHVHNMLSPIRGVMLLCGVAADLRATTEATTEARLAAPSVADVWHTFRFCMNI